MCDISWPSRQGPRTHVGLILYFTVASRVVVPRPGGSLCRHDMVPSTQQCYQTTCQGYIKDVRIGSHEYSLSKSKAIVNNDIKSAMQEHSWKAWETLH